MKQIGSLILILLINSSIFAQDNDKGLKISLQTDLLAYTTKGGWSAWAAIQHHQNKLSFAYVNFPNRYADYYEESAVKEDDQFFRMQLARYFNPDSKMKNFFYGANFEYHLRTITEDNNPLDIKESGFKLAPVFGFEWHPWNKKKNVLQNFSLALWGGPTFLIGYEDDLILPATNSVYESRDPVEGALGVMLSYTIFKNYN